MDIAPAEIAHKQKIGVSKDGPVLEIATKGGYHMVVVKRGNTFETLGVGPHRGVARYIAQKKEPSMVLHEFEKSESLFIPELLVQKYSMITEQINSYFLHFAK